ncbi:hypothetical protein GCM10023353_27530 [Tomitella cavernea]|uniref:Thiolase C-terminal domain-containing protein n=2 Tax=Tomitella cavernea TaxID=1387982 RepID=A0ABP9CXT9_9ACTN
MGPGPVPSSAKALDRAGLTFGDTGVIDHNEAFAAQTRAARACRRLATVFERI